MNDKKKGAPSYKLELCTRDKGDRIYADLGALWLDSERPFAMFAGAYKERLYVTHVKLSNGKAYAVDSLFLNCNEPKQRTQAAENFDAASDDDNIPF